MIRSLLLLLALPLVARAPGQQAFRSGLALGDFYLHDPWVLADGESRTYFLYTAGRVAQDGQRRSGVVVYTSRDLETWAGPQPVFAVPDGLWANPAHGAWAPEVHRYGGKYYLLVTLHNNDRLIDQSEDRPVYQGALANRHLRATQIFVSESPAGPFTPHGTRPVTPEDFMTLDGTLYVEDDVPYMVYAHEWIQMLDGTMEAVRLKPNLTTAAGEPFHLFKASDAPWLADQFLASKQPRHYEAEGPNLYRTRTGRLLMLWSSWKDGLYAQAITSSVSGKLHGPWRQLEPLFTDDTGHGTIVRTFDGRLVLVAHAPTMSPLTRVVFHQLEDTGDNVRVKRDR